MKKEFKHPFEIVSDGVVCKEARIINDGNVLYLESERIAVCGKDDVIVTNKAEEYNLRKSLQCLPLLLDFVRYVDINHSDGSYSGEIAKDLLHRLGETTMKEKYGTKNKE